MTAQEHDGAVRLLQRPPSAVVVVGAGGTGGVLIQQLCRLLYGIRELSEHNRANPPVQRDAAGGDTTGETVGHRPRRETLAGRRERFLSGMYGVPPLLVVDGDTVEEKNVRRQSFIEQDVGKKKAQVLAERYAAAFGLQVDCYPHYLTPQVLGEPARNPIPNYSVVVGAVDNAATRALLHSTLIRYDTVVYLDAGNAGVPASEGATSHELTSTDVGYDGQVVCGARTHGKEALPFPAEVFPDLIEVEDPDDRLPTDIPCGEAMVSNPQRQVTNVLAATVLLSYLTPILTEGVVPNSLTFFDARKGYLRSQRSVFQTPPGPQG